MAAAAEASLAVPVAAAPAAVAAAAEASSQAAAVLLPQSSPSSASSSTVSSCEALRSSIRPSSDASRTMDSAFCSRRPGCGSKNSGPGPRVAAPGAPSLPLLSTAARLPRRLVRPCSKKSRDTMPCCATRSAQPSRLSVPPACRQHSLCRGKGHQPSGCAVSLGRSLCSV